MVLILQKLLSAFYNLKDYSKRCLSINYYSFHKKNTPSREPTSTRRFRYIRSSVATIYACLTSD